MSKLNFPLLALFAALPAFAGGLTLSQVNTEESGQSSGYGLIDIGENGYGPLSASSSALSCEIVSKSRGAVQRGRYSVLSVENFGSSGISLNARDVSASRNVTLSCTDRSASLESVNRLLAENGIEVNVRIQKVDAPEGVVY